MRCAGRFDGDNGENSKDILCDGLVLLGAYGWHQPGKSEYNHEPAF
jgi:hypothetical protein